MKVTKLELEKICDMIISDDFDIVKLGVNYMFNLDFYKACKDWNIHNVTLAYYVSEAALTCIHNVLEGGRAINELIRKSFKYDILALYQHYQNNIKEKC